MVTTIQEVDILQAYVYGTGNNYVRVLNANQRTGYDNWQDAIEPLDENYIPTNPVLSNEDFIQWENERIEQELLNRQQSLSIAQDMFSFPITREDIAIIAKINNLTIRLFFNESPYPTISEMYSHLVNEVMGTRLEQPVFNYIATETGLTNVSSLTTDSDKRLAWKSASNFLTIIALVWDARGQK